MNASTRNATVRAPTPARTNPSAFATATAGAGTAHPTTGLPSPGWGGAEGDGRREDPKPAARGVGGGAGAAGSNGAPEAPAAPRGGAALMIGRALGGRSLRGAGSGEGPAAAA